MDKLFIETKVRHQRKNIMIYLTQQEKTIVTKECGVTAMVLYDYYISHSQLKIDLFNDEKIAKILGLTKRIIQNNRLKLVQHNYIHKEVAHTRTTKNTVTIFYLGKESVLIIKFFEQLFGKEFITVNKVIYHHIKKYHHEAYQTIYDKINTANITDQDKKDLIQLFEPAYSAIIKKEKP